MKLPKLFRTEKGFTLIELLVVIAVLGILASVVLVAINPAERINEANDSGVKNDVSQVATALESYYTNNSGSYGTVTIANLVTQGYLKRDPGTVTLAIDSGEAAVWGTLAAASATCDTGTGALKWWIYTTSDGVSQVECAASGVPFP